MKIQKSNLSISRTTSTIVVVSLVMLLCALNVTAQFTFNGDYDTSWGVTNGYTIDPTDIIPELPSENGLLYTAQLLPDGSIIAGGRLYNGSAPDYFYVKKYAPNGAVDTTFGTNGIAVINFLQRLPGSPWDASTIQSIELPTKLVVQPDGKILFGAQCTNVPAPLPFTNPFGTDACLIRLNPNGSIDTTFGNNLVRTAFAGGTGLEQWTAGPGRLLLMTGTIGDGALFGTGGVINDIAVQADGRIILVGYARDHSSTFSVRGESAFVIRLNPNGTLDATFGTNGVARYVGTDTGPPGSPCWTEKRFYGVKLQPDGRILALGHSQANLQPGTGCQLGTVFAVTRWSASGVMETERTLTHVNTNGLSSNTAFRAAFVKGGKVLVSGSNANKAIMTRLDLDTLSVDPTFAVNGFVEYSSSGVYFLIEAIQADGKILGRDTTGNGGIVRFNPNGSSDQSFGNRFWAGDPLQIGRAVSPAIFPTGNLEYFSGSILVRPNGRINLVGYQEGCQINGAFHCWGIVTQQNTTARSGNHADFTNDGRAELAVFRPGEGNWYQRNSANGTSSAETWGIASDSLAPADYDGDGRTDVAIFRSGQWWIHLSSNGSVRTDNFGTAGDLPRPGDFDGDGIADVAVFRPSNGTWYWLRSSDRGFGAIPWGANGDAPVLGDFDGDGLTDVTVFRAGDWYQLLTATGNEFRLTRFGLSGDIPVAGDYDGDSKTDIAVFRGGVWYVLQSSNGQVRVQQWGAGSDRPVTADYDNDGKNDLAVYRGGVWWIMFSGNGSNTAIQYGISGDVPIPAAYLP